MLIFHIMCIPPRSYIMEIIMKFTQTIQNIDFSSHGFRVILHISYRNRDKKSLHISDICMYYMYKVIPSLFALGISIALAQQIHYSSIYYIHTYSFSHPYGNIQYSSLSVCLFICPSIHSSWPISNCIEIH